MQSPFPKTIALMHELGINPNAVLVDGIDINGYDEAVLDEAGSRSYDYHGDVVFIRKSWPSQKDALRVLDVFLLERSNLR